MYSKRNSYAIFFFVLITFFLSLVTKVSAAETTSQYYTLSANNISYHNNIVSASGSVFFKTDSLTVKTEKIRINIDENKLTTLSDHFVLRSDNRKISGENLIYNYQKRKGKFYNADTQIDDFYFHGQEIELVEEKDYDIFINQSSFTKCILAEPHYKITAQKIKIYPEEKIVAENINFWWGKAKFFYLPNYVIEYEEDEKGNLLKDSSLSPKIGYNTKDGITFELNYPYEITEDSRGRAYMNVVQRGSQLYTLNHTHRFNEKTFWQGSYNYDKDVEKLDAAGEDITLEKDISSRLNYNYNSNLIFFNDYHYNSERENQKDPELKNKLNFGLTYNKNDLKMTSTIGYDYLLEKRVERVNTRYSLSDYHTFKSRHDFINESLDKESYNIYSSNKVVDYFLKYRRGYDLDYLPYLVLDFNRKYNFKTDIGFGIQKEGSTTVKKKRFALGYNNRFDIYENLYFQVNEKYIHYFYEKEKNQAKSDYKGLLTKLTLGTSYNINKKLDFSTSLTWDNKTTRGDYVLSDDEIKENNILKPKIDFKYKTAQTQSNLKLENTGEYDLEEEEWDKIKINLTRKLDCHSFSFSYELIENVFAVEFSIF